jgi:phosphohistidine phosphatase SixA
VLERVVASTTCVLCIGHNRGWEEAASDFAGDEIQLKPGEAALLEVRGESWEAVFADREAVWNVTSIIRRDKHPQ